VRQLAWCGVIAPVLRIGLILVLGFLDPGYSQARDYLSELSAREAPHAALMNIAGIGLVGVLLVVFSVALYRASRSDLLATAGSTCLAVSGVAFVFVALFPCDPGCSLAAPTTTMQVHLLAGAIAMTAQSLAPLAFGLRLFSMRGGRWYASFSLACGAVALLAVAVLFAAQPVLTLPGLVQKTFQLATDLWVLVSALVLLRSNFPGDLQE
jgi:hypothetical membrane protein